MAGRDSCPPSDVESCVSSGLAGTFSSCLAIAVGASPRVVVSSRGIPGR